MNIEDALIREIQQAFAELFDHELPTEKTVLQATRKEFKGTHTFVTFPFGKITKKKPQETAEAIGNFLIEKGKTTESFNVVKGFLNLTLKNSLWLEFLGSSLENENFGKLPARDVKVMVEYSSPNTNKPLHLGHLRNIFLGYAVSEILLASGAEVMKTNLVNDRGIHICKSMLAYQKFGNGDTPESTGLKGDKLIGNYYVRFNDEHKKQIAEITEKEQAAQPDADLEKLTENAKKEAPIQLEAQEMLRKWEAEDPEVRALWSKMNGWVYDGFHETYKNINVDFDKFYYESEVYTLGKEIVEEGLGKGVFFKKENGSVWADLSDDGLDEKLLIRGDGTSVYMTQDMGTADLKYSDFPMDRSVYVVGNEQDYHFRVLQLIMKKLERPYAEHIFHLSYGMVELPSGKMKSREGTVVDADDLLADMVSIAKERTEELGKIEGFSSEELDSLYKNLALGALKYYLLRVDPKKKMLFNPEESIDFQGNSGVYLQYSHAKISAILRKAEELGLSGKTEDFKNLQEINAEEKNLLYLMASLEKTIKEAADDYSPALIANFMYELARAYGKFYADHSIFGEEDQTVRNFRVALSAQTGKTLRICGKLLGFEMPERM